MQCSPQINTTTAQPYPQGGQRYTPYLNLSARLRRSCKRKRNIDGGDDYTPLQRCKRRKGTLNDSTTPSITTGKQNMYTPIVTSVGYRRTPLPTRSENAPAPLFASQKITAAFAPPQLSQSYVLGGRSPEDEVEYNGTLDKDSQKHLQPPHPHCLEGGVKLRLETSRPQASSLVAVLECVQQGTRLPIAGPKSNSTSASPLHPSDSMPASET